MNACPFFLSFYAHHLTQGVQHFHQLALGVHDVVDVLVGHRNFIDDGSILQHSTWAVARI